MLDRTTQPTLQEIDHVNFVAPKKLDINAHVPMYHMHEVPNETVRLDLYFDAGKCRGKGSIAGFVNGLLLSGTADKSSVQINAEINGLGGFYESGMSVENAVITVYCLREHLTSIFNTITDAIENVAFIEKEVKEFLEERKQKLAINLEKVSYQAQREFQQKLFASNPAYSRVIEMEDFETVTIDQLKAFHAKHYKNGLAKVVLVGDIEDATVDHILQRCKTLARIEKQPFTTALSNDPGLSDTDKDGAMQTAIRVGRILFNKSHEDYLDFLVVHTILGDYFGSRLMSNIREDKGYTYGIGTALSELSNVGYFLTATEVRKDVKEDTLKEIRYEFERLRTELVPVYELSLVKNYMLGQLLKSADGPYAMTDLYLSAEAHGMGLEHYNRAIHSIHAISPERIRELAQKYLRWEDMSIVSFG